MSLIVLLTDFGHIDPYVGQMKGMIYKKFPEARIVDLCHGVQPFNVEQAGFLLYASLDHFPHGSVFAAVVDPGVGSDRRIVLADTGAYLILAPDNGLLSPLFEEGRILRVYRYRGNVPASSTFHGRDIIAPLAAHLARNNKVPEEFSPMDPDELILTGLLRPRFSESGLVCRVVHQDSFGNLILELNIKDWGERLKNRKLRVKGLDLLPVNYYAAIPEGCLGLVPGSQGRLEIAAREKSAAELLETGPGDSVIIRENSTAPLKR